MSHLPIILVTNNHAASGHRAGARATAIGQKLKREIVAVSSCEQACKKSGLPIPAVGMQEANGRVAKFWHRQQANPDASGITREATRLGAHLLII